MSTIDVKTEFLNMEIAHINYVSKGRELFTTEVSKTKIHIFCDEDSKKIKDQDYRCSFISRNILLVFLQTKIMYTFFDIFDSRINLNRPLFVKEIS